MTDLETFLKDKGITPTSIRLLVLNCLNNASAPKSLSDLENELETVDKSTISRTLSLFREHHLLHSFTDGSGSMKYELCHSHNIGTCEDRHVHFRCENCGKTICITSVNVPIVELPEGFLVHESNYVVTGLCPNCHNK